MEEASTSSGRAKRIKLDKSGRSAAMERFKQTKGRKNKYVVGEVENVYEEVDEKEYAKRVLQRQEDDWIVDEGYGYVEDGREVFDDVEREENSIIDSTKQKPKIKSKIHLFDKNKSRNILSAISDMSAKNRKNPDIAEENNPILDEILAELSNDAPKKDSSSSSSAKEYVKSFANSSRIKNKVIYTESSTPIIKTKLNLKNLKGKSYNNEEKESKDVKASDDIDVEDSFNTSGDIVCSTNEFLSNEENEEHTNLMMNLDDDFDVEMKDLKSDGKISELEDGELVGGEAELAEMKTNETNLFGEWESSWDGYNIPCEPLAIDTSTLPLKENSDGEKVFYFYWWDAYEDPVKQPGVVYLFGKVYIESAKSYVSCCVTVQNIERRIFILPREKKYDMKTGRQTDKPVTILEVYKEFNETVAESYKIHPFKSRRSVRKYAFEFNDVPAESEYLEVKYSANFPKLPIDLTGETFSRVFGTTTTSLELLLLERKIKGPSWLEIKNPQTSNIAYSWCKIEVICSKPEDVFVSLNVKPPPPLTLVALNITTVINRRNVQNEVVMISCLIHNDFQIDKPTPNPMFQSHFCAFTKPADLHWPFNYEKGLSSYKGTQLHRQESERSLINFFLTKLFVIDPDVIVGHDLYGFTIDTLIHRIQDLKVGNWSRLGRLKRSIIPQMKGKQIEKNLLCGRLVCDIHISAKELIRARSYDLDTLCKEILQLDVDSREDYSSEEIVEKYSNVAGLISLINATMKDTSFILKLMYELNVMPLALQITSIAGNIMSRTLLGGRSERNEFLLLHAFTEKDFIVPDKNYSKKATILDEDSENLLKSKKKAQYAGGLVLEPKKGFYDKLILLMDFNSLYPSIIQEYNICFTTVVRSNNEDVEPEIPDKSLPPGILPSEIRKLVESRRQVKSIMKAPDLSPELKGQYNIRQQALKLTANSMYGCLGFSHSRFYAKPLAALVTSMGREILMNTKEVVQKMQYEVIYGDTDSIMINTNCTEYDFVFRIGNKIKQEINKLYKHVELEVDGVYKYMLLLKKKKYAAVVLNKKVNGEILETREYKGLDIVRRDWSQLSAIVGRDILDKILSDLSPDDRIAVIRERLEKVANDLRNKKVPIPLLTITKQLAKNPDEYADKKSLPHLQVALRINSGGGKKLKAGDTVSYVICDDGSNSPAVQRAYHVNELKNDENLLIDINYYLSQQIHPVVSRLCEPIDGADAAFIAECLGLEPNSYKKIVKSQEDDEAEGEYTLINDVHSFKNCEKFMFTCMNDNCKTKIFMDGPMRDNYPALSKCRNVNCKTSPVEYLPSIQNALQMSMRSHINKLYENWMICEDPACPNRTRRMPMMFISSYPVCTLCKRGLMYREYRNSDLYYQLKYYEHIFNLKKLKIQVPENVDNAYKTLHNQVLNILNRSGYRFLNFAKLFQFYNKDNKGKHKLTALQRNILDHQKQWQKI